MDPPRPGVPIVWSFKIRDLIFVIDFHNVCTVFDGEGRNVTRFQTQFTNVQLCKFGTEYTTDEFCLLPHGTTLHKITIQPLNDEDQIGYQENIDYTCLQCAVSNEDSPRTQKIPQGCNVAN